MMVPTSVTMQNSMPVMPQAKAVPPVMPPATPAAVSTALPMPTEAPVAQEAQVKPQPPKKKGSLTGYLKSLKEASNFKTTMEKLGPDIQQALQAQDYAKAIAILQQMLAAYEGLSDAAKNLVGKTLAKKLGAQIANLQFLLAQQLANAVTVVVTPDLSSPKAGIQTPSSTTQNAANPVP